jgi:hypothetical protein
MVRVEKRGAGMRRWYAIVKDGEPVARVRHLPQIGWNVAEWVSGAGSRSFTFEGPALAWATEQAVRGVFDGRPTRSVCAARRAAAG